MIKKIGISLASLFFVISLFSAASFATTLGACPPAMDNNIPGFCSSFKLAAQCHCTTSGLPKGMCMNMKSLYDRMTSLFGSVRRACEYQHDTSVQNCIDAWSCYRSGGLTSKGELCSGTGNACE